MNHSPELRRKGVTLTELLVVFSIVGVLAALSLVGVHYARKGMANQDANVQAIKTQVAQSQAAAIKPPLGVAEAHPNTGIRSVGGKFDVPREIGKNGRPSGAPKGLGAVPQEYVIVFTPNVSEPRTEAMRMAAAYGGTVLKVFTNIGKAAVLRIPDKNFAAFRNDPKIAMLGKNSYFELFQQKTPTGIARQMSYPTLPANQLILKKPPLVNPTRNVKFGPSPIGGYQMVNVAVIDTGVDVTHPDLNVVMSLQCSDAPPETDTTGHGTHCAGIIGARNNTIGVIGVYPGAPIWSMKIENLDGTLTLANILQAYSYVFDYSATIRVANMSFGGGKDPILDAFASRCAEKGVIMVAAAGNSGIPASLFSPASAPNIICVAAMGDTDGKPGGKGPNTSYSDPDDTMAIFSNWGSACHVIAPGVDINSTVPVAQGSYGVKSGTSMACPHVVGYLALLLDSKVIFGHNNRNIFVSSKPGAAVTVPAYAGTIATELIPGILGDPLSYPMVNFRIQ